MKESRWYRESELRIRSIGYSFRAVIFMILVIFAESSFANLEVVDSTFRADIQFREYWVFWNSDSPKVQPLGGSIHLFVRNSGEQPVAVTDIILEGVSLKQAIAYSKQKRKHFLHPASIHFSEMPKAELDSLMLVGEPVWWKADPMTIHPGETGEIVIRVRRKPELPIVRVGVRTDGKMVGARIPIKEEGPRIKGIFFSPSCQQVYVYFHNPGNSLSKPVRIFIDGQDVTETTRLSQDVSVDVVPAVIELEKPLFKGTYHCFQAEFADGTKATAGLRAWTDSFAYGIWGGKPGNEADVPLARWFLNDLHRHNMNVHVMTVGSRAVQAFMKSAPGVNLLNQLAIRRIVDEPEKDRSGDPYAIYLVDEPDAGDYRVNGLEWDQKVGSLAQGLVEHGAKMRAKCPVTPNMINVNMTFKPYNWYTYGQVPDIFAADPYYQARLRETVQKKPDLIHLYNKATFVHAVGTVAQSACAPKPLHLILFSVAHREQGEDFRFPTPEEKRIEVYYALAAGAKGLSYWWYSPGEPAYGCGAPTTEAKALWKQIGLLGAEARTLGPVIMKSCPSKLEIDPSSKVWVRALVSGLDTIVLFCVNDDYTSDENGTTVYPVDNAEVNVKVPTWLEPKEVFEVNYRGVQDIGSKDSAGWLNVRLGKVEVSRLLVITSDPGLRERLKTRYRESFQNNVQSLLADSP